MGGEGGAHEDVEEKELSRRNGEDSARGWKTRDAIRRRKGEGERQPGQPCSGFSQQQLKLEAILLNTAEEISSITFSFISTHINSFSQACGAHLFSLNIQIHLYFLCIVKICLPYIIYTLYCCQL